MFVELVWGTVLETKAEMLCNYSARSGVFSPTVLSFSVFLSFSHVCSDSQHLPADVKQRTTGMHCQMETGLYHRYKHRQAEAQPEAWGPCSGLQLALQGPKNLL